MALCHILHVWKVCVLWIQYIFAFRKKPSRTTKVKKMHEIFK